MGWLEDFVNAADLVSGGVHPGDLPQGRVPGSTQYNTIRNLFGTNNNWGRTVGSLADPLGSTLTEVSTSHGVPEAIDAAADPTHSVNWSLEELGTYLPPELRAVAPLIGAIIGTVIYPVAGTAAGYGAGAHIAGKSSQAAQVGAGQAAVTSYLGGEAADALGSGTTEPIAFDMETASGAALGDQAALVSSPGYGYSGYEDVGILTAPEGEALTTDVFNTPEANVPEAGEAAPSVSAPATTTTPTSAEGPPIEGHADIDPFANPDEVPVKDDTWSKEAWEKFKEVTSKDDNISMLDNLGRAFSGTGSGAPGQVGSGGFTVSSGATMFPEVEEANIRRLSAEGMSKPTKAKSLFNLDIQKKPASYDIEALVRDLAKYKQKEEEEYV